MHGYDANMMSEMTKADCMKKIQELKGYVAEGNPDPYGAGTTEDGKYQWDIYEAIEAWEKNYEEAPEEVQMVEVKPSLEIKTYGEGDKEYQTDDFCGYVVMPDGADQILISYEQAWELMSGGSDREIHKILLTVKGEEQMEEARAFFSQ